MSHDDHHATTPNATNGTPALAADPPPELIIELRALLVQFENPKAPIEIFRTVLEQSLASFLTHPGLHWWCHPDLRPIATELLHIFSLDENPPVVNFKNSMENVLSACLDCSESYLQDRRVYLEKLVETHDREAVDIFFRAILDWDCTRLETRIRDHLNTPVSSPAQKRKKISICELLLDPSLLLMPEFSKRISGPLSSLIIQVLQHRRIKVLSVLPGLWLLTMHQDPNIQSWAVYTTTLAASGDSLVPERWTGWEQFSQVWKMALDISSGSFKDEALTALPLSTDPVRAWRAIRAMLSSMGSDAIKTAISCDSTAWKTLQGNLLRSILDSQTPPAVFLEMCRITFHLLGNLKQAFWTIGGQATLTDLPDAEQILRSVFSHDGTLEYVTALASRERSSEDASSTQALARAYAEYTSWVSNYISSLAGTFGISKVLISTAGALLTTINDRGSIRKAQELPPSTSNIDLDITHIEYELEILNVVLQLLDEQKKDETLGPIAEILSEHWSWLAPIGALGSRAMLLSGLMPIAIQRITGLATRASNAIKWIAFTLLDREVEIMWRNYSTATTTAKAAQVGKLEISRPLIWLRLAQVTSSISGVETRDRLDTQGQERLMEWQTSMVERVAKLALLPKLETKPTFSPEALQMSDSFNDSVEIFFRANAVVLQCLASLGKVWLQKLTSDKDKRFLIKVLKLWCSPDSETRAQALFIMRSAWQEVTRASCLRLAFQIGGEKSIEELDGILVDFRERACPGGSTPAVLFELLLDSVTTLFLNNPIDGEGGLYLQIFLDLTSSQEVARHVALIKKLWDSIWMALKAALYAGRTIWADRQDRAETIKTMTIVANVGLLIIGKIRYFERLLEFEKQDMDPEAPDLDVGDGDEFEAPRPPLASRKETMPLDAMKAGLERMADWTFAQDTALCTSAIKLVCAVLDLLADHDNLISDNVNVYLTSIAEANFKVKSLLTLDQRETLWIALSRHVAYSSGSGPTMLEKEPSTKESTLPASDPSAAPQGTPPDARPATIEISDDDFSDIDEVNLTGLDFEDEEAEEAVETTTDAISSFRAAPAPSSNYFFKVTDKNNPYQSKLNFTSAGSSGGIPAGGSTPRRLPSFLDRFNLHISRPGAKAVPVKKGHKLSQMRADHRRERSNIVQATKEARSTTKLRPTPKPPSSGNVPARPAQSDTESENESDDGNNGLSSLIETEETWNNRNKPQEPRKTKMLDLKDVVAPGKLVDTTAVRRQKLMEDAARQRRLTPNLTGLHRQILTWEVSATGDRPPGDMEYAPIPAKFEAVHAYVKAFEPLLVLECWQHLMGAREEANQSSDSLLASFVTRVAIDDFQDHHMKIPLERASSIMVEDIVVVSDPNIKDVFAAVGNLKRPKPFFAKVQSITRAKGQCEVVFRTHLKVEETSALMFMRPPSTWSVLKMINLTTIHREYAALVGMRYYELCDDVLNPPNAPALKPSLSNVQKVMDTYKVNTPQAQAIVAAIEKPKGFSLIQGPPGTGKTKTILGLVGALLADDSRFRAAPMVQSSRSSDRVLQTGTVSRILVCAPSNAAIDEITKRLMGGIRNSSGEIFTPKVVRIGTLETINMEVKDVALDTLIAKELESSSDSKEEFQSAAQSMTAMIEKMRQLNEDLAKARLELVESNDANDPMTIANSQSRIKAINKSKWKLGQDLDNARSNKAEASQKRDQAKKDARNKILGEADVICSTLSASGHDLLTSTAFTFETVIIDEAAQSVEISSLIPLKYGCKRCILVGDPNQLPPTVISQLAAKYQYNQSLFVRIQNLAPSSVHLLSIQYRMHPDISVFPSREFYGSLLKDGPGMAEKTKAEWHQSTVTSPYRFFDVHQGQEQIGLSHSQHNPVEAEAAVALLEGLCNNNPTINFFRRVGVISPYKQQVRTLKEYFQKTFDKGILEAVDFNTVDGFQGQEKDIIIFSCVRASSRGSVGFLSDVRRMNVALTRARQSLFILGHADTLRRETIWGDLVKDAESRGLFTRVTQGLFGRRSATVPKNIMKPKAVEVDRRNELYGRIGGKKKATAIDRPIAVMEDIVEATSYPTLPGATVDSRTSASKNSRILLDRQDEFGHENGVMTEQDSETSRALPSPPRDPRLQKRRQEDLSKSVSPRQPRDTSPVRNREQSSTHQISSTSAASDFSPPKARSSAARSPSPKRSKPTSSLFLKSKPMSMKRSKEPSRQYDVPVRERLASQVVPIRRSYPSDVVASARPTPPSKRAAAPSIDDILGSMDKRPRGDKRRRGD